MPSLPGKSLLPLKESVELERRRDGLEKYLQVKNNILTLVNNDGIENSSSHRYIKFRTIQEIFTGFLRICDIFILYYSLKISLQKSL
jgi:hypothetical protein